MRFYSVNPNKEYVEYPWWVCQVLSETINSITRKKIDNYLLRYSDFLFASSNPFTFSNVAPGSHNVIIRDNLGCQLTRNLVVAAGPPLTASIAAAATSCHTKAD
jgi:hypothetical protein